MEKVTLEAKSVTEKEEEGLGVWLSLYSYVPSVHKGLGSSAEPRDLCLVMYVCHRPNILGLA